MSDEPSDVARLPVLSSQQGLSVQRNSLVKRGLELVAASGERLTKARSALEIARWKLDEAQRASLDPATWDVFVRHCLDTYRYGLLAVGNYLEMHTEGERCVEFARRLVQQSKGFEEHLPNRVANSDHFAAMIDVDREQARRDWEQYDAKTGGVAQTLGFSMLKAFVEDVGALIEPPESGTIVDVGLRDFGGGRGDTVTILRWLKSAGEKVDRHEPVVELSVAILTDAQRAAHVEHPTAKWDFQFQAAAAGTLSAIFVKEGETVPIDTALAIIETP